MEKLQHEFLVSGKPSDFDKDHLNSLVHDDPRPSTRDWPV